MARCKHMQWPVCKNKWGLKGKAVIYLTVACVVPSSMKKQSGNCGSGNQQWLRDLPFEKQQKRYDGDEYCRDIHYRSTRQNNGGACNCSSCRGRYALHKRAQLWIAGKFLVERPCNYNNQIYGKKNAQRGSDGPAPAVNNVADESYRDHNWTGRNHCY